MDGGGDPNAITATIEAASLATRVADRDAHLRSPDFLNVERFSTVTFRSTAIESLEANRYRVTGDLTIRGESHPVAFALERADAISDPWGNRRIAGTLSGKVDRRIGGLTWNQALEFGALLVGEKVQITIDVQVPAPVTADAAA